LTLRKSAKELNRCRGGAIGIEFAIFYNAWELMLPVVGSIFANIVSMKDEDIKNS